jgi:hypothetical protein
MAQALARIAKKSILAATFGCVFVLGALAQQDPPSRVARLNYVSGNVSMEPADVDDWMPAEINHPFTVGDYLYTDAGARTELHLDVAAIRMGPQTSFGFLNLNDQTVQIKLTEGDMYFRIHSFGPDQVFEVDTPNAAVQLLRDGVYRFRVDPNGAMSFVVVREGQAEVTGGGQAFTINPNDSAMISGADQPAFAVETAPAPDDFDNWCAERDAREARAASRRYLPPTVIGYEDLDQYGAWQEESEYGPVWYPREVVVGWTPYQYGHWAWIQPWGWTWVDAAPWGFAPFHYGRWAYIGHRWGWCPGPIAVAGSHGPVIRPYYAPALVAWFGGAHWGVSVSAGPSLGWVPLGFGEIYTPAYACSRHYFRDVNVYNTRVVNNINITKVYNTVYVNKTVYNRQFINMHAPSAMQVMPQSAFASGRPVHQAAVALKTADLRQVENAAVVSPGVTPNRQALLSRMEQRPAARPAPQVINRQVVAVHPPAVSQAQAPAARMVRPVAPVQAEPGQRFGHPAAFQQENRAPQPQAASPVQPRAQAPAPPANRPAQPQQTPHGVPPNRREDYRPEINRPLAPHSQPQPGSPMSEPRNTPARPENRPAERPAPQPPVQPQRERPVVEHPAPHSESRPAERAVPPPQHERPAPEVPHNQPSAPHAQPAPPPANHGEQQHHDRPPEHGNGERNNGHNDHKSQ